MLSSTSFFRRGYPRRSGIVIISHVSANIKPAPSLTCNSFTFTVNPLGTAKCAGHYGIAALIVLSFISLRYPSVQKLHLLFGMEPVLAVGHDGQLRPKAFRERGYGLLGGQIVPLAV